MVAAALVIWFILFFKEVEFSEGTVVGHVHNVTILTEDKREHIFKTFVENYKKRNPIQSALFDIQVKGIKGEATGLLPFLRQFSEFDFSKENSFLITDFAVSSALLSSLLGTISLVVFDIRNRPLNSQRGLLTNVVSMKPSLEEQGKAMKHFIRRLGFKRVEKLDYCISHMGVSDGHQAEITRHLKEIKAKQADAVIVKCPADFQVVLKQANHLGMGDDSWKWVIPEVVGCGRMTSFLPEGLLAFDVRHSRDVCTSLEEVNLSYLEDSLVIIQRLIEVAKHGNTRDGKDNMDEIKKNLKSLISRDKFQGHTGNVEFNSKGCRANVTYDIYEVVSFLGERRWLRVGSWLNSKINTIFTQWTRNYSRSSRQIFRVVTHYGEPWVNRASSKNMVNGKGLCLIGHLCRNYTNRDHASEMSSDQEFCCGGFMMEFLLKLEEVLHFDARVYFVKDQKFGSLNRSAPTWRAWNGMIGELIRDEADIALHLLTITADRLKVVDFSHPYMESSNGILVSSRPFSHSVWEFVFLTTFAPDLWFSMLLLGAISVLVIWLAERLRLRRRYLRKPHKRHRSLTLLEIISYTWSLAFQKAAEELGPSSVSARVLAALFAFSAILVCSSFTANLAAMKVTEKRGITLSGIHDSKFQNPSEDFSFSVLSDSAVLDWFRDNSDPALRSMTASLQRNTVNSLLEASRKLQSGKFQAFVGDIPMLKVLAYQKSCDLKISGKPFFFSSYGIAFSKNFIWRQRFSFAVLKLQDDGFLNELVTKWIPQHCRNSEMPDGPSSLGLNEIGGTFLLLILGCIVGTLMLVVEYCIWRWSCYPSKS